MQASFLNIDAYRFSLNGVNSYKIFIPVISGDLVKIVNVYDSGFVLVPLTNYADFQIGGISYGSSLELANALGPIIYSRQISGAVGSYSGVSDDANNLLTNGTSGMPFLSPDLVATLQSVQEGDSNTLAAAKAYAETIGGGQFSEPTRIVRYVEGYDSGLTYVPFVEWKFDGQTFVFQDTALSLASATMGVGETRIDLLVANSVGVVYFKTGTPAVNPSKPALDLNSEIEVTFVIIAAGETTPQNAALVKIYGENAQAAGGEFDVSESTAGARINKESIVDKYAGTLSLEATALNKNDTFSFFPGTVTVKNDFDRLKYRIKNKPGNYGNSGLSVTLEGHDASGAARFIALDLPRNYGWDYTNTAEWQLISLPIPQLDRIINIEEVRFRNSSQSSEAYGFFIDEIYLVAGANVEDNNFATISEVQIGDAATLQAAKDFATAADNDLAILIDATEEDILALESGKEPLNVPPIADTKVKVYNLDGSVSYEDYGGGAASLLSKSFTYTSGAQTFTADFDIVQVDTLLVGNIALQRDSQYTVSGAVVTILDTLTSGAVIELNYWKANAVNATNYTKAESDSLFSDKLDKTTEIQAFVSLTQAAYDAIVTPSTTTIYFIE